MRKDFDMDKSRATKGAQGRARSRARSSLERARTRKVAQAQMPRLSDGSDVATGENNENRGHSQPRRARPARKDAQGRARLRKVKPRARKDAQGFRHGQNARNEGRARTRARSRKVKPRARTRARKDAQAHMLMLAGLRDGTPPENLKILANQARSAQGRRARSGIGAQGKTPSAEGRARSRKVRHRARKAAKGQATAKRCTVQRFRL